VENEVIHSTGNGIEIKVFVLPRSSQCKIAGLHDNCLKIKLTKPPVDGLANEECCKTVAKHLGVPKSSVSVIKGRTSRSKVLLVEGISEKDARERLF